MEHVQELVRSTSRTVAAQSPLRFSARDAAPLPYDVEGLDAEKLGYRLGTLALAAVATQPAGRPAICVAFASCHPPTETETCPIGAQGSGDEFTEKSINL